ncbi:MAG TPA: hypothetical protein ENN39_10295 [Desulfonatronum sp.]|nr:hypothetical protein [Desulfonatronum sp.]
MDLNIAATHQEAPVARAHVLTMTIKSFKGRRNVDVHLYRAQWNPDEMEHYDWEKLLGDVEHPESGIDPENSRKVLLEAFTLDERDQLIQYLQNRYGSKLESIASCSLNFPIPRGLTALSDVAEGKSVGRIRLENVPKYTLSFPVHGLFDLNQHEPIMEANGRQQI